MMRRLGPSDYRDMPWKNGGGTTRELWKLPRPGDPSRFLARLSIATVAESGPFSVFPGVDRTLMLMRGEGMVLTHGEAPYARLAEPWRPFAFPGEVPLHCELIRGPVVDFNLMVDRALLEGSLEVLALPPGELKTLPDTGTVLLHGLGGRCSVSGSPLSEDETLWLEAHGPLGLLSETGASVIAIRLQHRS